jgi:ABC-2 type transport system ATP-binding protein
VSAVDVDDVTKRYGALRALDGVSLTVAAGEVLGLVGRNGAGKSTLLRILTGRAAPTSGTARVLGHEMPRDMASVRGRIGLVADTQNVYRRATARENLELFCALYGLPRRRADEVLAAVRLEDVAGRRVKTFSTGMRQRLVLARALLNRPHVLLLDEPGRGLDPWSARELRELVSALAEGGTAIVLATHDLSEVDELCRRVAVLEAGRVVALGEPGSPSVARVRP